MKVNSIVLNINSTQPATLFEFYRDVVGLPVVPDMGETALDMAGTALIFDGHSEIAGPAKEPARHLLNFFVDDVAAEQARIEGHGVKFCRTAGREYWGGIISTFNDPDGNFVQIIEFRPESA